PDGLAADVLAEPGYERRWGLCGPARGAVVELALEDVAQEDHAMAQVGDLDANRLLARDRGQDPNVGRGESVGEVVLELRDLGDLCAGGEAELEPRNTRAAYLADDRRVDVEVAKRLHQQLRDLLLIR